MRRRHFLRAAGLAAASAALPDLLHANPYAPLPAPRRAAVPVRIRGRVTAAGRGVDGVAVSDGLGITTTSADGSYTLVADASRPFVFISVPAGHRIPTSATGTAAHWRPIAPDRRGEQRADFALERSGPDDAHAFLLLADTQTQNAMEMGLLHAETVPDVQATVRALGDLPAFGVACGDIMYDDLALYPEYERAVAAMGVPFFQVVGNHDLDLKAPTAERAIVTFGTHFGPAYYSFDRGEVHYVVLEDVFWHGTGYIGHVGDAQLQWLATDLARVERGRTVVVFLHIPLLSTRATRNGDPPALWESVTNREAIYRLLEPYQAHALSGHTHEHEHPAEGGVRHHVHGTVCGAWWSGPICWDGTPNGYGVYEARGPELRWRYKSTGQPPGHQLRAYPAGADPKAPDEVVANVWDWTPEWTVAWYEDGDRRGLMARRPGKDPLSVELHTGPDKPPRRQWVEPTVTAHLFYARPSRAGSRITVEATDPWGRRYVTG